MIIKEAHPLISCICITDNRPELLYKAICGYYAQAYPNKELVISYPESDQTSKHVIDYTLQQNPTLNIIEIERPDNYTIGKARNHAIAQCTGGLYLYLG